MATDLAQPFSTPSEQCIVPASTYHTVNPYVLRSILTVESGLKSSAIGKNRNGSVDIGIGQINSIHLKELSQFGIGPTHLQDACIGTYVAAWHLKKAIAERGNTWEGVASYHSRTPYFNKRYQALIVNEMIRSGAMQGQLLPVPPLNPLDLGASGSRGGLKAAAAGDSQGSSVIIFDTRQ
ncbi:Lytic transglycosylase, catalytic (plasmid) [Polaromonas sp. JS666]|nr:Lytic transglycosylase, catalytic [Polaromonas sp. JS666]